jgi:hypothetical protein
MKPLKSIYLILIGTTCNLITYDFYSIFALYEKNVFMKKVEKNVEKNVFM